MRTRVHVCLAEEEVALAASLLADLRNPWTGLVVTDPLRRGGFDDPGAATLREKLAERIIDSDVTACLVGPAAYSSSWIRWEIEASRAAGLGFVGIRLRAGIHDLMPPALVHTGAQIVDAHVPSVIAALERAAFTARTRKPENK